MMSGLTVQDMMKAIGHMADIIIENEVYFCELDSVAGDGDFGMSVSKGFKQLKAEWQELNTETVGGFLKDAGMVITEYCGGASGPIWGSAFRAAGKYTKDKESINLEEFGLMLDAAVAGIQKRGKAKLGDKTLLDALIPTTEAIKSCAREDITIHDAFVKGAEAARDGAEKTKSMVASMGRASYVGERSLDHPDAGAMALGIIFTEMTKRMS
jgi:dihydroxyacetone kinase